MADDRDRSGDEGHIDTEKPQDDANPHRNEGLGDTSGAPEAAGWAGPSGGMGASGAMGGAGAAGAAPGATDPTLDGGTATAGADPGDVKTEYEMGYEADPALEPIAESGPRGGSEPEEHPSISDDD